MNTISKLSINTLTCIAVSAFLYGNSYAEDLFISPTGVDLNEIGFSNSCTFQANPCQTIAHALTWAVAGDTLRLAGGRYTESELTVSYEITIEAEDPSRVPVIDAQENGRHFFISPPPGSTVVMRDLRLINGNTTSVDGGGSIYVSEGLFELSNSELGFNTSARNGGAIACAANCETLLINDSIFESNSTDHSGGAVSSTAPMTILSSLFRNNSAPMGAGGAVKENSPGGIAVTTTIRNSQFTANNAEYGGAFSSEMSAAHIFESSFVDNISQTNGSAIWFLGSINDDSLRLTLENSTIANNVAGLSGAGYGAIYMNQAFGYWRNLSFVDNGSTDDGRHVYAHASTIELTDSYFYTSLRGQTEACVSGNQFISVNNLWEDAGNVCFNPVNHVELERGSLSPLGRFGPLGDLDGTTLSYLLTDESNALDAGSHCGVGNDVDQRGAARGAFCDIGATEQGLVVVIDLNLP